MRQQSERGFSLVELITVMVIIGVIAAVATTRMFPNKTLQLQAGRDLVISALFVAQQRAMVQAENVRLSTQGGQIDIRQDRNSDGHFAASESIRTAGGTYPLPLPAGVTLSTHNLHYNRLGKTTPTVINVAKDGRSIEVTVTEAGYAY